VNDHRFPAQIVVGPNAVDGLDALVARFAPAHVLVVSDAVLVRAGIAERAIAPLERAGIATTLYTDIAGEPTVETVRAAARYAESLRPDTVVGIGGGSVIDVAKLVAALLTNGGDVADYWGADRFPRRALPKVLIPTTAGTGSEVSQAAVIADAQNVKHAANAWALLADVAVVDATLTVSAPPKVTADSGMDAVTHAIEAYLGKRASALSDALAERAFALLAHSLVRAYRDGRDLEARAAALEGSMLAGMAFNSAGLGAVHALAYPLDTHFHVPHGRTNAVLLPAVLRFNAPQAGTKLARLAALAGTDDLAAWIEQLLRDLGISPSLRDYGVPRERVEALAREGWESGQRLLVNNVRAMTRDEAEELYASIW
jgi:alcohol dehydrogenase class IV